jgi:prepilin-type N-terminal cleavage/methylation domain-containing protein
VNKKAFTLIELLGVIIILGIVLVIAIPETTKLIDKTKNNAYKQMITDITKATKTYVTTNAFKLDNFSNTGDSTDVTLYNLINAGLLKNNIVNPKTKEKLDLSSKITVTISASGGYTYTYDIHDPIYVMNGLVLWLDGSDAPQFNINDSKYYWMDKSGNANNGELKTMAYPNTSTSGYDSSQKAYLFDGIDDYIAFQNIFTGKEAIKTLEVVFSKQQLGGLFSLFTYSNTPTTIGNGLSMVGEGSDSTTFKLTYGNGTSRTTLNSNVSISNNTIYHVLITIESGQIKIYVNGVLSNTWIDRDVVYNSNVFVLGRWASNYNGYRLTGLIKAARAYNRALSQSEVIKNYNADKATYGL